MSRAPLLSLLLVAGCARSDPAANTSVDINAAAAKAQGAIDSYEANSGDADTVEVAAPDTAANSGDLSVKTTAAPHRIAKAR